MYMNCRHDLCVTRTHCFFFHLRPTSERSAGRASICNELSWVQMYREQVWQVAPHEDGSIRYVDLNKETFRVQLIEADIILSMLTRSNKEHFFLWCFRQHGTTCFYRYMHTFIPSTFCESCLNEFYIFPCCLYSRVIQCPDLCVQFPVQ